MDNCSRGKKNKITNFQGVNRYRGLRQTGAGIRNGVRKSNDTEKVHGDHAPLKHKPTDFNTESGSGK